MSKHGVIKRKAEDKDIFRGFHFGISRVKSSRRTHFSRCIIFINNSFLQELMKRTLVLGKRMTRNFVDENFEPSASFFDETRIKDSVVISERQQPVQGFSRQ